VNCSSISLSAETKDRLVRLDAFQQMLEDSLGPHKITGVCMVMSAQYLCLLCRKWDCIRRNFRSKNMDVVCGDDVRPSVRDIASAAKSFVEF
jgi:hypothetical protein